MLNLFRRRRRERDIFQYWDGAAMRVADPLVLWRQIFTYEGLNPDHDFPAAFGFGADGKPVPFDLESEERVIQMIKDVFSVSQFGEDNQTGLTLSELTELMMSYLAFMTDLKKKHKILQTQPALSEPPLSETSTIEPESESSSTPSELKSGEFTVSSKQSDPPSAET